MQRKLLVMRHAHSASKEPGQTDHDRELTPTGRSDALRVAAAIQQLGWTPQAVVSSDATRTRQTWEHMSEVFEAPVDVAFTEDLYLVDLDRACEALFALDDDVTEAAIIGHNPGWQELVRWLSGVAVRLRPATAVLLTATGDSWPEAIAQNNWTVEHIVRPSEL
jgi:phosphohistidine phosphatase